MRVTKRTETATKALVAALFVGLASGNWEWGVALYFTLLVIVPRSNFTSTDPEADEEGYEL